jgi:hypothetical protein
MLCQRFTPTKSGFPLQGTQQLESEEVKSNKINLFPKNKKKLNITKQGSRDVHDHS